MRRAPCASRSVKRAYSYLKLSRFFFPLEQTNPTHSKGANSALRRVKDIIRSGKSISNTISVKAALDEMQARGIDSSPVTDERGQLLGTVSKNKMNRDVGGLGHDPQTEPVEAHIDETSNYCYEHQTIAEVEQIMITAKLGEVLVVTGEKLLVGTINIEAIAQEKNRRPLDL